MKKPTVILAETDEFYIQRLTDKLVEMFGNEIQLSVVTDPDYFEKLFSSMQSADTLLISESLYTDELLKHDLEKIVVLSEDEAQVDRGRLSYVSKYGSIKKIISEVVNIAALPKKDGEKKETKVIAFASGIGGAGRTTLALALAACMTRLHFRALYICTGEIQSFQYYLHNRETLTNEAAYSLSEGKDGPYDRIRKYIRKEEFFYLPPLGAPLESLQIPFSVYEDMIGGIRANRDYDFVILDLDVGCDAGNAALMSKCDHNFLVVLQDAYSVEKNNYLVRNMNFGNAEKYLFLCNKFEQSKENYLMRAGNEKISICEYIDHAGEDAAPLKLSGSEAVENLVYMLT